MHFTRMDEGTDEDFQILKRVHEQTLHGVARPPVRAARRPRPGHGVQHHPGDHCSRPRPGRLRDGKDEEYVVVALLHDIGESLGPFNHGEVIAAILRPFISRDNSFMLEHHGLFQTYFFAAHLGLDPNARDRFKGDPAYERTVEFCAKYDEVSFDPALPATSRCPPSSRWCGSCSPSPGCRPNDDVEGERGYVMRTG